MTTTLPRPATVPSAPPPRRRRTRLVAVLAAAALVAAAVVAGLVVLHSRDDAARHYVGTDGWPVTGQAAYRIGSGPAQASAGERPVPIASLAKVMTAYVVLQHMPLGAGTDGPAITVTAADVRDYEARKALQQSVVEVRAGERLTERDALMALLLPSANNVAEMLARTEAGSRAAFVTQMNRAAGRLGMTHTHYTDPSGYDASTVSTAADQLRLADALRGNRVFAAMVGRTYYRLPVAGVVHNTDILLGKDGFVGTKTGSDDAAGSCFMFASRRWLVHHHRGREVTVTGVVLGQPGHNLIVSGQYAAQQLVDAVAPQAPTP